MQILKFKKLKMKSSRIIFVILLLSIYGYSQSTYTVIKVYGGIQYKESKKNMMQGDVFSATDPLIFSNSDSKAAVINKEKGRFILTPPLSGKLVAPPVFVPAMGNISARGIPYTMMDLQDHFSGKYLIIKKTSIKISSKNFPMNDTAFFFLRYIYKGEEINKKLSFSHDSLIIDQESLLTVDGRPIPNPDVSEMKLYYLSGKKAIFINEFEPVFPEEEELKKEVQVIVNEYKGKEFSQVLEEVLGYLNEFYGKPDKENISNWLKTAFNL